MKKNEKTETKVEQYSDIEDASLYESDRSKNELQYEEESFDLDQLRIQKAKQIIEETKKHLKEDTEEEDEFFEEDLSKEDKDINNRASRYLTD